LVLYNIVISWHETNYEHLTYNKYTLLFVSIALSPTVSHLCTRVQIIQSYLSLIIMSYFYELILWSYFLVEQVVSVSWILRFICYLQIHNVALFYIILSSVKSIIIFWVLKWDFPFLYHMSFGLVKTTFTLFVMNTRKHTLVKIQFSHRFYQYRFWWWCIRCSSISIPPFDAVFSIS
jgi:hypothetical protein